jgi:two-component system chemotaxis sensor kinase CheA
VSRGFNEGNTNTQQVIDALKMSEKLSVDLRQAVLDLRMLPMNGLFTRLERAASELSTRLNKPFHIFTTGHNVAVDKAVLSRIFDPLLHMLRNACDHGLENAEEREKSGKPDQGIIRIEAAVQSGGVSITVSDDGRGLNIEKIRAKAIEKNLISKDQNYSENEIRSLIFRSGFSTTEKVTDVSGRGVGMDVVLREIRMLGGQIEVHSELGKGTEFLITLPSNISLVEAFIIITNQSYFTVPTSDVLEIIDLKNYEIETSSLHKRMIKLRDEIVPLLPLSLFLKFDDRQTNLEMNYALIVRHHNKMIGLIIDEVVGQQQIFVRPLTGLLAKFPWISGSTILSNGEPAVIINAREIAAEGASGQIEGKKISELESK